MSAFAASENWAKSPRCRRTCLVHVRPTNPQFHKDARTRLVSVFEFCSSACVAGGPPRLPRTGEWRLRAVIPPQSGFLTAQKVRLGGRLGPSLPEGLHGAAQAKARLVRPAAAGVSEGRFHLLSRGGESSQMARGRSARLGRHLCLHHRLGREENVPGGPNSQGEQQGAVQAETPSLGS